MEVKINAKQINNVYSAEVINFYTDLLKAEVKTILRDKPVMNAIRVFTSYAHLDDDIQQKLNTHLATLRRTEKIVAWDDNRITPGANWDDRIKEQLQAADLILLLISANFIQSQYIWDVELSTAMTRSDSGAAIIIPIFCKPCDFAGLPFAKLQGLPRNARPLVGSPDLDEALTQVAIGIRLVVEGMLNGKG